MLFIRGISLENSIFFIPIFAALIIKEASVGSPIAFSLSTVASLHSNPHFNNNSKSFVFLLKVPFALYPSPLTSIILSSTNICFTVISL